MRAVTSLGTAAYAGGLGGRTAHTFKLSRCFTHEMHLPPTRAHLRRTPARSPTYTCALACAPPGPGMP